MIPTLFLALAAGAPAPAPVTFHFMQIQQVIGGVNGDVTAQAVQLRMRSMGQNQVSNGRLVAYDANGLNPVVIVNFTSNVPNGSTGDKVLVASAAFLSQTSPAAAPDFTMTNLIPASYLAAGSLTFENNAGTNVIWRLSWGGSSYTGSNAGSSLNDDDGNYGPPWPTALPTASAEGLRFKKNATATSTSNAGDYELTCTPAVFRNNANTPFTVVFQAAAYCTPGTTASGCQATMSTTGAPSLSQASGFVVSATDVEGAKDGIFFYGTNGAQANSWGNGTSFQCVVPPVARAGLMTGTGTSGQCDGSFAKDFNAFWSTAPAAKVPAAGDTVRVQTWFRDPLNTSNQTTSLSDALSFAVCP